MRLGQPQPRRDRARDVRVGAAARRPGGGSAAARRPPPARARPGGEPVGRDDLRQHRLQDAARDHQRHGRRRVGQGRAASAARRRSARATAPSDRWRARRRRRAPAGSGSPAPKRAWKRKKRRMRRWSSAMRCSGSPMKRTRRAVEVGEAAEIIVDLAARRLGAQRVDREVAPRRVLAPIVGEGDDGVAAVGRDVAAQRRHLDRPAAGSRR